MFSFWMKICDIFNNSKTGKIYTRKDEVMFAAVLSHDIAWASAVVELIMNKCIPKGRYIELELFQCPHKLLQHLKDEEKTGTVIMSADQIDDLMHAKNISQAGAKVILLTDSNDIAIKAYSIAPEYCTYKAPDDEDIDRISSIIFCH